MEDLPTILVVEDDQLLQGVIEDALTDGDFEIVIAGSGESAVELLTTADGKYRALVTDVNLGRDRMSGWDIARHAREIDPAFPIIYMSGDSAEDWSSQGVPNSIEAVRAGATCHGRFAGPQQRAAVAIDRWIAPALVRRLLHGF